MKGRKMATTTCAMCGTTRNRFPKAWVPNDCNAYCNSCWVTVGCTKCSHHDPKGKFVGGRWMCRKCIHHKSCTSESSSRPEMYYQLVIEDQNGETSENVDCDLPLHQMSIPSLTVVDRQDDDSAAEAEEGYDDLAPLPEPRHSQALSKEGALPAHIVLLLDVSGSMRTVDVVHDRGGSDPKLISRLDAAASCAAKFVVEHARKHPKDVFSIATFAGDAEVLSRALDAPSTRLALQEMAVHGANGTFYKAALKVSTELLSLRPGLPSHMLILSDGRPADTKVALSFFQQEFMRGAHVGTRVHGIGFGNSVESFVALQQLACLGNGSFALSDCSVRGLCDALSSISSTITSSQHSSASGASNEERSTSRRHTLRPAEFEQPELGMFGKRGVLRFRAARATFKYDGMDFTEQTWPANEVARRICPHMRGGMRLVYAFQDTHLAAGEGSWMVAKCSRFVDEVLNTREVVGAHAKSSAVARYYAARFNQQLRTVRAQAPELFFVPCFLYECEDKAEHDPRFFAGERYLPGMFLKYNSNNGYVCEDFMHHQDAIQAFLHFTFVASGGKLMVADLQGVAREKEAILTDPQVLSLAQQFGPGDLSARGMRACLASHRCGPTCRALGLKPVDASLLRKFNPMKATKCRASTSSSAHSLSGWERLSNPDGAGSDWDRISDHGLVEFAMSDGARSSQCSSSSWTHLLDT